MMTAGEAAGVAMTVAMMTEEVVKRDFRSLGIGEISGVKGLFFMGMATNRPGNLARGSC